MPRVVECAPNGVALTKIDGRIMLVNAELERMFGLQRGNLVGTPIELLVPERFRPGHARLRECLSTEFHPRSMGSGSELIGQRADGSEFPIEVGINALQTPEEMMMVETIVDISVRKRLERMFQKIVEAAPCAMIMVEASGRIALVNPQTETMFGYSRVELIGKPLEMLLPERLRAAHAGLRQVFASAPSMRQMGMDRELTARRKDGTEFPVEIGLNPVPADDGALVLAAVTNITHRNALQLELRQANANLKEFTYAASHDLKSPLRGIADLVTWIAEDLGGSASVEVERNLGRVMERIRRLGRVIDDLLAYAHAGTASGDAVRVDLRELIDGVLAMQPPPAGFRTSVQIESRPFVTRRAPLESVLRNLIGNAAKHHDRASGLIDIRAADIGRYCALTVSDDGPGIPSGAQKRIFRMFQTVGARTGDHSGIGLALSKRMVEVNGGRLELESTEGARGATFRVWWPRFQWRQAHD